MRWMTRPAISARPCPKISTATSDPHNEDLTCGLERQGIIHQLLSIHVMGDDGLMGGAGGPGGVGAGYGDDVPAGSVLEVAYVILSPRGRVTTPGIRIRRVCEGKQ